MKKKTYGAPRYMDWVAQIRAGAATVRVHFTGGALTVYGVTPAEYTTTNPFTQKVIEQSQYFKEGRITLIKTVDLPDPQGRKPQKVAKPQTEPTAQTQTPVSEAREVSAPEEAEAVAPANETAPTTEEAAEATEERSDPTQIEVSCLQDAQAYLQENFNISSYKVRTYDAAQRAASEHGVQFVGAKFDTINGGEESESETAQEEE